MKELSIEKKAKAYDKALEKARQLCAYPTTKPFISDLQDLFPELKESEGENIREWLIEMVEELRKVNPTNADHYGICSDAIAWLEKQGECHISHDDEIMIEQLTEYFTTGHGLQNANETVVAWLNDVKEKLEKQGLQNLDNSAKISKDKQKPAEKFPKYKKGDVLTDGKNKYEILSWDYTETGIAAYYMKGVGCKFSWSCEEADKKLYIVEQKPDWSEEDEKMLNQVIEDIERLAGSYVCYYKDIDWLKSLKPQNRWKPSDEQMKALDDFIYAKYPNIEKYGAAVKSLYQDLKKLRGE